MFRSKITYPAIKVIMAAAIVFAPSAHFGNFYGPGVTNAHATGCCGGRPKSAAPTPSLNGQSDPDNNDDIGLGSLGPLNAAVREAAGILALAGPALRETRQNIEALTALRNDVSRMGGITNDERFRREKIIDELIREQQASRLSIRIGIQDTVEVLTELLGLVGINGPAQQLQAAQDARATRQLAVSILLGVIRR